MSVDYKATFNSIQSVFLEKIADSWKQGLCQEVIVNCNADHTRYDFFAYGSIRGVSVTVENDNELNIRLNYCASPKDAELAASFMAFLIWNYSAEIFGEEGDKIDRMIIETITKDMTRSNSPSFFTAIFGAEAGKEYIELPLWDAGLIIYKEQFDEMKQSAEFPENFNRWLQTKAYRIYTARRAARIKHQKGTAISVWAFDDMIVYPCDAVAVSVSPEEIIIVKWADFLSSPSVAYETIPSGPDKGAYYFVYGIDEAGYEQAIEEFRKAEISVESL